MGRTTETATGITTLLVAVALAACAGGESARTSGGAAADLGIERSGLSPRIDNPFVAFAAVTRAVYQGIEVDAETGESVTIRVESVPRDATTTVAGVEVAIVDVSDYENGDLIERTEDYYVQHRDGTVYYMGERVDDIEDGEVVGHHGQWFAGQRDHRPGVFMPAAPHVGAEFEQERAPGVAEDRSTVVAAGLTVIVPAGTFTNCIETEDRDPIDDVTEHKFYCPGAGLVREVFPAGGSLDLIDLRS